MKILIKNILQELGKVAQNNNLKLWAVGGIARDYLLNKNTQDIDICVEGNFEPLLNFCRKNYNAKIQKFLNFGTARANLCNGIKLDFVRCRQEIYKKPASLPIVSPATIKEDLFRRDFTCNAMALSLLPNNFLQLLDLYNGKIALKNKKIEILHDKSFLDDPTRIFRAFRFASRFDFSFETNTEKLLKLALKNKYVSLLSPARKTNELLKILEEKQSYKVFRLMKDYKLENFFFYNIKIPKNIDKLKTIQEKLALLVLAQKNNANKFLDMLDTSKENLKITNELLNFYKNKKAPLKDFDKQLINIIKLNTPKLPKNAYKKCFITPSDLLDYGYKNIEISKVLDKIRTLQFNGTIKSKKQAEKFLR